MDPESEPDSEKTLSSPVVRIFGGAPPRPRPRPRPRVEDVERAGALVVVGCRADSLLRPLALVFNMGGSGLLSLDLVFLELSRRISVSIHMGDAAFDTYPLGAGAVVVVRLVRLCGGDAMLGDFVGVS